MTTARRCCFGIQCPRPSPPSPPTPFLSCCWRSAGDVKQKEEFSMPKIGRRTIEDAARENGYSRSQAKRIAARIVARPDWGDIQSTLAERFLLPHSDPTAWDAVWNVLTEQLARNHAGVAT